MKAFFLALFALGGIACFVFGSGILIVILDGIFSAFFAFPMWLRVLAGIGLLGLIVLACTK